MNCPSESVRKEVTSCAADGSIPTYREYQMARYQMQKDEEASGVLDWQRIVGRRKPIEARPWSHLERKYIEIARAVMCRGARKTAEGGPPVDRDEAQWELARLYFDASHWEEAAALFHASAVHKLESSHHAANLALEAINVLAREVGRADCGEELAGRAAYYVSLLCRPPALGSEDSCAVLARIAGGAEPFR